jgi:hypothetical protein
MSYFSPGSPPREGARRTARRMDSATASAAGRFLAAVGLIVAFASCRTAPQLIPRLILQGEDVGGEFWLQAPYIAVVKVIRAGLEGPPQAIFRGGPKNLQPVRFDVNVENVIKGDLREGAISFIFIIKTDQNQDYYLRPGRRYIVSLRREANVLRSWADGTQLKIWVHSGSHRQQNLPLERGPSITIAYILLTPGGDADLEEFRNSLGWPPNSYGEPHYVHERLRELQLHPNRAVRDSACLSTASMFWYRPPCLAQVAESPDSHLQAAAKNFLGDDVNLLGRLRSNPFFLSPEPWTEYTLQMLEAFTDDMRPEVRKAACAYLRNVAPLRVVEACR